MKTSSLLFVMTLLAMLLGGCAEKSPPPSVHVHGTTAQAEGQDEHSDHAPKLEKITDYSATTELYLERPPLFVGQAATLVVHLTRLADFHPLTQGKLSLVLSGKNGDERFDIDQPVVPGIYKPIITPRTAGDFELSLQVETPEGTVRHELGPIPVFADAQAAANAHQHHNHGAATESGIPFTKEQQWKVDFAVTKARRGPIRPSVAATATIRARPDGEAQLTAPVSGVVQAAGAFPQIGQSVKKGQILAWLIPRLGGDTDQATLQAAAGKARIALEQARRERERMEALFKDEAIAEKRLFEARANEGLAVAEAQAAQARQNPLGGNGGMALRAPIDGVLVNITVTPGAALADGAPLFHIARTDRLRLEAHVAESDIGRLETAGGASFTVAGFARPFIIEPGKNGKRVAVGGVVDAATRTVPVLFEFAHPGGLRLGMTAQAQLEADQSIEGVLVPNSALQDESGTTVAYVQTGGESFERRIVRVGARNGQLVAIIDGIEEGERVVSQGAYLIRLSTSMSAAVGHAH